MPEYSAGTAFIQLLPSATGFEAKTNAELKGINPEIVVMLKPEVDPAAKQKSEQDGDGAGARYGDAFTAAVKSRIDAALRSLPDAKVGIDATDADAKIAEIKAALEGLSKAKIGVDVSADDALVKLDDLRAQLDELARHDPNIAVRVDAADASAKLAAISDEVRKLDGKNVVIDVKVDPASAAAAEAQLRAVQDSANAAAGGAGGGAGLGTGALIGGGIALGSGALGGAVLAAIPVAYAAIGVAAEKSNEQVQAASQGLVTAAKQSIEQGFAPLVPEIVSVENQAKATITGLEPEFAQAATAAGPLVATMSTGLLNAVKAGVSGSIPILQELQPEAQAVANGFGQLERGIGGFLNAIDPKQAAQGLSILGADIEQILPAVGTLLSDIAPLGNAILSVAGPAVKDFATDFVVLKPAIDLVSGTISVLSPEIAAVAPPVLAVMAATKLLTGSWTDFSGAGAALKSVLQDANGEFDRGQSTLSSLASVVGINTKASRDAAIADAELAVTKANLVKAAAEEDAAEASTAALQDQSAKSALAESEANVALAVATKEAAAAETTLADANEAASFSFGPIGIALGVIGAAIALVAGNSSKATQPTSDLTQELVKLGQAAPEAASGIVAQDPALQQLIPKLSTAGTSIQALSAAYAGGASGLKTYTDGLHSQHDALGNTQVTQQGVTESLQSLVGQVNRGSYSYDLLTGSNKRAVDQYNAQNDVIGQLNQSMPQLVAAQQSQSAITQLNTQDFGSAAGQADALGVSLKSVVSAYQDYKNGVTYAIPASIQMAQTFLSQTLAVDQAKQSVTSYFQQANQGVVQAQQSVANASHGVEQAVESVANAQHSYAQSVRAVADAEQQVVLAQNNVTKAQEAAKQAQTNLTQAYIAAQQALKALQLQMADQVASEESQRVSLFDAQQSAAALGVNTGNAQSFADLANTPGGVTAANEAQVKAALQLIQAENQLNDTLNTGADLRQQKAAADAAGVAGSQQVLAAQQALKNANDQVTSAEQQLTKAQQGVTDATYNEQQARKAISDALYNEQQARQAVTTANQELAKAQDAASTSLDQTTAAGQRNLAMLQQLSKQLYQNEDPTKAANDLINATATAFGTSAANAEAFLKQEGLIPPNFQFGVTAVASVDMTAIANAAHAANVSTSTFLQKRDGGPITGPGGPRDDQVPLLASNGEFIVNAKSTAANLGLLHAINAGQYANGGLIAENLTLGALGAAYQDGVDALTIMGQQAPPGLPVYVAPVAPVGGGGGGGGAVPNVPSSRAANEAIVQGVFAQFGWGSGTEWDDSVKLIMRESGFNNTAQNPHSTAYGIFEFLNGTWGGYGIAKTSDPGIQALGGARYIQARYHDPIGAWAHETNYGWYDQGGFLPPGITTVFNGTGKPEPVFTNEQWQMLAGGKQSSNAGGEFTGSLYLDNGQFIGVVRGEIEAADQAGGGAILTGTR